MRAFRSKTCPEPGGGVMADELRVEIEESPQAWSVVVRGEVDISSAPQLEAVLDDVIAKGALLVVLELEHVDFLDSSGLRVILGAANELRDRDGSLVIGGASTAVLSVLEITGVIDRLRSSADAD
jgi:anti-sigma B factor antagonist